MEAITTAIPLVALRESPFNPRQSYPAGPLRELAESIATQGVLQPIVVRPVEHTDADEVRFEVVIGHRRLRASHLAKQQTIPALVRAFTDAEAAVAQIHENAKREDVNAVEEAAALERLHRNLGMTPAEIAAEVGRSLSSVYNSLKLARADESLHRAILDQKLPPQVAYEVARVPWQLQSKALEDLRDNEGEWFSYRDAKATLRRMFQSLDAAPFPIDVAELVAGVPGCDKCPKRAGNEPTCSDLDPMLCLDMDCFAKKTAADVQRRVAELRKAGEQVIEGDAAKAAWPHRWNLPSAFVPSTQVGYGNGSETLEQLIEQLPKKAAKPKRVHIVSPHDGQLHAFISRDDARTVMAQIQQQDKRPTSGQQTSLMGDDGDDGDAAGDDGANPLADWSAAERVFNDHDTRDKVVRAVLAAMCSAERRVDELRGWLLREYDMADCFENAVMEHFGLDEARDAAEDAADKADVEFEERAWLQEWLQAQDGRTLAAMCTAVVLVDEIDRLPYAQAHAARLVARVESYGVDVLKAAGVELEPQAPAKKLPKGVKYHNAATGDTWSGKGQQPKWLKAALASGRQLSEFAA